MTVSLTPEQLAWITAHVDRGEYLSVEDAVRQLIDERIAERAAEDGDLSWAMPNVERALAEIASGQGMTFEEYEADIQAHLASLKG